jgi:predicted O-methyltransferase YrrM
LDLLTSYNPLDIYRHYGLFKRIKQELADIVVQTPDNHPVGIKLLHATHGSLKFTDAYILKQILHKYKPDSILEIGSFLGFSTRWLLEVSRSWGPKVTAVDPNIRHRIFDNPRSFVERLNSEFYQNRLEIITGFFGPYDDNIYYDYEHHEPRKKRDYVNELIKDRMIINRTWERKFDFIFIDGDHAYSSVMNNFEIAVQMLNERGSINFHDALSWTDVNKAIKEIKVKYHERADVDIYGSLDRILLKTLRGNNDGIGSFRLLR